MAIQEVQLYTNINARLMNKINIALFGLNRKNFAKKN